MVLLRPTFAVRQGGASASSTPQNGQPAPACTALVSRQFLNHNLTPCDNVVRGNTTMECATALPKNPNRSASQSTSHGRIGRSRSKQDRKRRSRLPPVDTNQPL